MKFLSIFCLFFAVKTHGYFPPENFGGDSRGESQNVFVDFQEAKSVIIYDLASYTVEAQTSIQFHQDKDGYPIFDLLPSIKDIKLDGESVTTTSKRLPDDASWSQIISQQVSQGDHRLEIKNNIERLVSFDSYNKTVRSAFWMSDLSDRRYLERYLPTNFEYDQYQNTFEVKIINTTKEHNIYANGTIREIGFNHFEITFPEHYTSSSIYFHCRKKCIPRNKI